MPWANLRLYHKGVYFVSVKIFNGLSKYIADSERQQQFVELLRNFLIYLSFYSVNEFMDYCCASNVEAELWNKICVHYWDCGK